MPLREKRRPRVEDRRYNSVQEKIYIHKVAVPSGKRTTINIPVAHLHTHTQMTMPVHVVHGKKKGPRLFVSAAIHGDEILGVEIVRRLIKYKNLQRLRGVLVAVPVVNVFGFINHSRYMPDRRDLNRFFPGSGTGSLASRLADIFMSEIVANSTHGIDLHTGSNHRINLPQVRAHLGDPATKDLALSFGAPVVIASNVRDGSLRQAVMEQGIPMLLYEAGEALRFDEVAIRAGIKGILNVMRSLGMLPQEKRTRKKSESLVAYSTTWIRAPKSGILRIKALLGQEVGRNERVGLIADPFGENEEIITSPANGVVIGRTDLPLVHEGDAVFHIARLDENSQAEPIPVEFHERLFDPE